MVDENPVAVDVMRSRLAGASFLDTSGQPLPA
jgi:hypothetical protein